MFKFSPKCWHHRRQTKPRPLVRRLHEWVSLIRHLMDFFLLSILNKQSISTAIPITEHKVQYSTEINLWSKLQTWKLMQWHWNSRIFLLFFLIPGDKLIYLDPHTTQLCEDLDSPNFSDESYHCPYPSTMNVMELDPSIALVMHDVPNCII